MTTETKGLQPSRYLAVVKVALDDPPEKRAREIADGIGYAAALLQDEYGWDADRIEDMLNAAVDEVRYQEENRDA